MQPATVALAFLLLALLPASSSAQVESSSNTLLVDRVVAVINESIILKSELSRRVAPLAYDLGSIADQRERNRRRAKLESRQLEEMINEELIVQAAEEAQININAKQVQAAFDEIKNQNSFDDQRLAAELRKQGYTVAGYRKDVRRQLMRLAAVNQLVRPRVSISDEEVLAKYDENKRRSGGTSQVQLQHILIALPESPNEQETRGATERANAIIARAKAGEKFAELAQAVSDDEGTKASGGELGWIERGSLDTEWESIVFSMKKGEVRGPVSGPRGLHIFHVKDTKQGTVKPFDEVKETLRSELFRREMDRQTRSWLDELRRKAYIDVKL